MLNMLFFVFRLTEEEEKNAALWSYFSSEPEELWVADGIERWT